MSPECLLSGHWRRRSEYKDASNKTESVKAPVCAEIRGTKLRIVYLSIELHARRTRQGHDRRFGFLGVVEPGNHEVILRWWVDKRKIDMLKVQKWDIKMENWKARIALSLAKTCSAK